MEKHIKSVAAQTRAELSDTFSLLSSCGAQGLLVFGGALSDKLIGRHTPRDIDIYAAVATMPSRTHTERAEQLAERLERQGATSVKVIPNRHDMPKQVHFTHNGMNLDVCAGQQPVSPKAMLHSINMGMRQFVLGPNGDIHTTRHLKNDLKDSSITLLPMVGTYAYHRTFKKAQELQAERYPDFGICSRNQRALYLPLHAAPK